MQDLHQTYRQFAVGFLFHPDIDLQHMSYPQLLHEIKAKNMTDERIHAFMKAENWIDYQDVFTKRFELSRQLSLEEALGRVEIEPEGNFHDGLDDAVNTGYLIEKLELNPEYQLVSYEMPDKPSERLSSTLGELFAGLDLRFT